MTFVPKYVFYREAVRIVAERVGLKESQVNPLDAALSESQILPEVIVHGRPGQWRRLKPGEWDTLENAGKIIRSFAWANPNRGFSVAQGDDHVRILMAVIDRLWPPAAVVAATGLVVPADEDRYFFPKMILDAIDLFKKVKHPPKKEDLEQHFRKQKLPDGTPISARLADAMATLSRPWQAMRAVIGKVTRCHPVG
jgi:hypothetical protein